MMRDERATELHDDQSRLEQGFPSWLQNEVNAMKRSWEIEDSGRRGMRWDTIWCELNADVNYAEIEGIITKEQADYLRQRVLRMRLGWNYHHFCRW